jgi:hypothetical protein
MLSSINRLAVSQVTEHYREFRKNYETDVATYGTDRFLYAPRLVSLETYVKCNASCNFCPYPTSTRIDQKLDTDLVYKIIDDVASSGIDPEHFVPARLNEPMLDKRLFDICDYAARKFPTTQVVHFTNGTTLTPANVERIINSPNVGGINISLNSHRPDEHRRVMGISFGLVVKNLQHLHVEYERRSLSFFVSLSRVGDGTDEDIAYYNWCKKEFPLFDARMYPRFDWLGKVAGQDMGAPPQICKQWHQLHFLANGKEAFCCIDDDGKYGRGDIRHEHALEIYNHPSRLKLRTAKSRGASAVCAGCTALI